MHRSTKDHRRKGKGNQKVANKNWEIRDPKHLISTKKQIYKRIKWLGRLFKGKNGLTNLNKWKINGKFLRGYSSPSRNN